MLKTAIMVSGGGTNLQAIIDAVESGKITNTELSLVVSNNPNAKALERADKAGIRNLCLSPKSYSNREEFDRVFTKTIMDAGIDLIVLAGFMMLLPKELVQAFQNRIINIHPALIPSFCGHGAYGLHVHEMALEKGVKVSGATVHFVDEVYDNGPIVMQKAVEVHQEDTPETLQKRIMEQAEWIILPKTIDLIANGKVHVENGKVRISD